MTIRAWTGAFAVCLTVALSAQAPAPAQQSPADVAYTDGRRLFETLDYETAIKSLDTAIATLQGQAADPARRDMLASAYEMRARSRFGIGDPDGAQTDFVALLKIRPDYTLTGQVSPRVVTLFDQVVQAQVTTLKVALVPASATLAIDGTTVQPGTIKVVIGDHVVTADQRGYRPFKQTVSAAAATPGELAVTLERVSAAINISTSPADVDVSIDGVKVGKTVAGPANATASAVLSVADIVPGAHVIQFSRTCLVPTTVNLAVDKADDYTVGPVTLKPATASLTVSAPPNITDAQVFINNEARGTAPLSLPALCAGDYTVEVRHRTGLASTAVTATTGGAITVATPLRPRFAIVSSAGKSVGAGADLRVLVERALARTRNVSIFAPPADRAAAALEANRMPGDWLALDANGKPLGSSTQLVQALRGDASTKMADTFNAQGVASVTLLDDNRVVLALLAAGSSTPDILELRLDRPESSAPVIDRLERTPSFSKPMLGLTTVDVAEMTGAVVVGIDAAATTAGIQIGDVIVGANTKPVANVAALTAVLDDRAANDMMALDLIGAGGAKKQASLKVVMTPRLISMYEPSVLANRVLTDLRARLASAGSDTALQSIIHLNIAVALARAGDWPGARDELQRVQLPAGPGVGPGTVQYLLGLVADQLGNRAEADAALKKAMEAGGLVTEDGPAVRELAEAKLADPQRPR